MHRFCFSALMFSIAFCLSAILCQSQTSTGQNPPAAAATKMQAPPVVSIPANAPHMSTQTRLEIIRDFMTQIVYSRAMFPMGTQGLKLKDGVTTPGGQELQQAIALLGPSIRPGDPAEISFVHIKDNYIHFDLNGGAIHRKKWYQHIEVSGTGGATVPLSHDQQTNNPHGSYLDLYFDKYVPEMTAAQLRALLYPVLDFNAHSKEEAYLDTVPPNVKEAIKAHHVLVGMNSEMVLHAKGTAPKKCREKDGEIEYEEWIYGEPPQDVDFVRIVNDEVVRVETMKVGGEKIVRTQKEVILDKPDKDAQAKIQENRPANAPTLRRPSEAPEDVPKPADDVNPVPPSVPPTVPTPPSGDPGPGDFVASH